MKHISTEKLHELMHKKLLKYSLPKEHANYLVDTLIMTSLWGIDTHGVDLFATYIKELNGGRSNANPQFKIDDKFPASISFDADDALGVVAANVAARLAIEIAKKYGVAAVSVSNSNHFGAAGVYSALAAAENMIGICMSNSDPLVSAHNGIEKLTGTNPIGMCAPGLKNELFLLDMATSQVAYTKVKKTTEANIPLQPLWSVDGNGIDSSISNEIYSLLPLGGYKGQGLGMMVQIISALLSNMPFDSQLSHLYSPPYDAPRKVGHFFLCLNIQAFTDTERFKSRVSELLSLYRGTRAKGESAVIVPGDKEQFSTRKRREQGIPISEDMCQLLNFS